MLWISYSSEAVTWLFNISWSNQITQDVRPSNCCVIAYVALGQKSLETPDLDGYPIRNGMSSHVTLAADPYSYM